MKKICAALCLCISLQTYAQLSVEVSPNPVVLGQDVQLILKKKDNPAGGLPDLSALEKDFSIVGTQQSHAFQNINGVSHQEDTWLILMNPKHPGKILIPSLTWGREKTNALSIDVQAMDKTQTTSAQSGESVLMKWDIKPEKPMVHEQVKITLKIYHTQPLLDAKLLPPSVDNALLFALDSQTHLMEILNQQRYQVEQYRYIVYPQNQGNLRIHPPVLDALEYGMIPTPIHQTLAEKTLMVIRNPSKNAIPAEQLSYQERKPLSKKIGIPLGDTVVRQVEIIAKGLPAQLIPDIQSSCGKDCKVFINPPKVDNQMQNGQLYGHKTFEITYLPEALGVSQIKSMDIPWFNTRTRQLETLKIPAIPMEIFRAKIPTENKHPATPAAKSWLGAFLGFLFGGICMALSRYVPWKKIIAQVRAVEFRHHALKQACLRQDAPAARIALLQWARAQKFENPIRDLHDIARQIPNGDFKQEIQTLIAYLFSRKPDKVWQSAGLWRAFHQFKFKKMPIQHESNPWHQLNP